MESCAAPDSGIKTASNVMSLIAARKGVSPAIVSFAVVYKRLHADRKEVGAIASTYTLPVAARVSERRKLGEIVVLRYVTTDGQIEICWPCRVVEDRDDFVALFIAAGSPYKAEPKKTAAEKRRQPRTSLPPVEYVWRNDTLRLMFRERSHSVSLFWGRHADARGLLKYFVNMEEPFRRTAVGFDTQDHTLDIEVTPELACRWRDEEELANHVAEGFYTADLARAARSEGEKVIEAIRLRSHECLRGWPEWSPPSEWGIPPFIDGWDTTPPTFWDRREWAYGPVA